MYYFTYIGIGFIFWFSVVEGEDGEFMGEDFMCLLKFGCCVVDEVVCVLFGFGNIEGFVSSFFVEFMDFDIIDMFVFMYKLF